MTKLIVFPALLVCVVLSLGACAGTSSPSKFYLLTPVVEEKAPGDRSKNLAIGIGPIEMPAYLDRPQIVSRTGSNSLKVDEFHRWAEPLKDSFTRALVQNISSLLSTDYVFVYPWQLFNQVDYRAILSVSRFDRDAAGRVILKARWVVSKGREEGRDSSFVARESSISQAVAGEDYDSVAAAMSAAVGTLSREIAQVVITLEQ